MSRYIDAIPFAQAVSDLRNKEREEYDNLVGKHRSLARSIHGQHVEFCEKMLKTIREQPTVDAVQVVRCGRCEYYSNEMNCCSYVNGLQNVTKTDYCSYGRCADGERR